MRSTVRQTVRCSVHMPPVFLGFLASSKQASIAGRRATPTGSRHFPVAGFLYLTDSLLQMPMQPDREVKAQIVQWPRCCLLGRRLSTQRKSHYGGSHPCPWTCIATYSDESDCQANSLLPFYGRHIL